MGESLSWSGVKEGERKITQICARPGSIYLAIGAKTSSSKDHRCVRTWLVYVSEIFHTADFVFFNSGKVAGIHLLRQLSNTQLTLTDCSHQPEGEGPCDLFALHCTLRESCTFRLWRLIKKCAYRRNGIMENLSGFMPSPDWKRKQYWPLYLMT